MTKVTASELQKNFGRYQAQAQREPVRVTSHGRDSVVLISAKDFERYQAMDNRQAYHVSEAPDGVLEALNDELEEMKGIEASKHTVLKF